MKEITRPDYTNEYEKLVNVISKRVEQGVEEAAKAVSKSQMETYWDTGKYIVEYEQVGQSKAEYGLSLLKELAKDLTLRLGKGYSRPNLYNMRQFYISYPDGIEELKDKLTWSHICELIRIEDPLERSFYQKQSIVEKWSVRTLQRQKKSSLFLRLAASRDKKGILALSQNGVEIQRPEDIIKETYTLEFLKIPENSDYNESELETRIIDNLQKFLLELGKGFTFVGRQYNMTINNRHYRCDLVFYHRILKCFVLIDLKVEAIQHEDVGQMNMYLGYIAEEENEEDDNPPVGIILSREKDELLVKYATYGMDSNLFVSRYELYLPNKEELKYLVDQIMGREDE
ncbi:MAG: PDDEXK nuclease domain-containing protein [Hespellia sp.]|nr:PDDEXK nuclease domain-containing protein [Hespellia sp.]